MPQNPINVQEFRAVGGLSGTAMSASVGSAFVSNIKSTPGCLGQVDCISSGAIAFYDAALGTYTSGTVSSAVSSALGSTNNNLFFSNSSIAGGSCQQIQWPCTNGIVMSVSGGVWAIRFS
jgi:hypothetical protein